MLLPQRLRDAHARRRENYLPDLRPRQMDKGRELTGLRKDGREFPLEVGLSPIQTDGKMLIICFVTDLTERRKTDQLAKSQQQQLMPADKMATLGILVSGVAREINNPNNFILLNGKFISRVWNDVLPILQEHYEQNRNFTLAGMPYTHAHEKIGGYAEKAPPHRPGNWFSF